MNRAEADNLCKMISALVSSNLTSVTKGAITASDLGVVAAALPPAPDEFSCARRSLAGTGVMGRAGDAEEAGGLTARFGDGAGSRRRCDPFGIDVLLGDEGLGCGLGLCCRNLLRTTLTDHERRALPACAALAARAARSVRLHHFGLVKHFVF